jgi:hypothetical protein
MPSMDVAMSLRRPRLCSAPKMTHPFPLRRRCRVSTSLPGRSYMGRTARCTRPALVPASGQATTSSPSAMSTDNRSMSIGSISTDEPSLSRLSSAPLPAAFHHGLQSLVAFCVADTFPVSIRAGVASSRGGLRRLVVRSGFGVTGINRIIARTGAHVRLLLKCFSGAASATDHRSEGMKASRSYPSVNWACPASSVQSVLSDSPLPMALVIRTEASRRSAR